MKHYINLHAHSTWSDGADGVRLMAHVCRDIGLCACVLSDHAYAGETDLTITPESWEMFAAECRAVSADMGGYPVVPAIEISVQRLEECVVIGEDAIREIFRRRKHTEDNIVTIAMLQTIRQMYECLVVVAHPGNLVRWVESKGHRVSDGFERVHCMSDDFRRGWKPWKWRKIPKEMAGMAQVASSDAHSALSLGTCYTEVSEPLLTEHQIIRYFTLGSARGIDPRRLGFDPKPGPVKRIIDKGWMEMCRDTDRAAEYLGRMIGEAGLVEEELKESKVKRAEFLKAKLERLRERGIRINFT